jgi:hypothetical protein
MDYQTSLVCPLDATMSETFCNWVKITVKKEIFTLAAGVLPTFPTAISFV